MAPEGVEDRLRPGRHLLRLGTGEVPELLAAHGEQGPEDHDLLVLAALEGRLEAGAQGQGRLAGAGAAAEGDDADLGVEQHLQRDPLLGGAAVDAEGLAVATHQPHLLVGADAAQGRAAVGEQHQSAVARQLPRGRQVDRPVVVQLVELGRGDVELGHAGVPGVGVADRVAAVVLGVQPDGRGLDAQREVLGDQRDVVTLVGEVARDGQDPGVVVAEPEAGRQRSRVGVVELDPDGAAVLAHGHRLVEPAVGDPQVVEHAQGAAREEAQLGMVSLALELGDHHDRQDHLVLGEPLERAGVGEQHAGVEDERPRRGADCDLLRSLGTGLRHRAPLTTGAGTPRPGPVSVHADGPGEGK